MGWHFCRRAESRQYENIYLCFCVRHEYAYDGDGITYLQTLCFYKSLLGRRPYTYTISPLASLRLILPYWAFLISSIVPVSL